MKRKGFVIALSLISAIALVGCAANASTKGAQASAFQTTQERLDIGHTFRVAVIHLFGVTDNKKIYFFMG